MNDVEYSNCTFVAIKDDNTLEMFRPGYLSLSLNFLMINIFYIFEKSKCAFHFTLLLSLIFQLLK